MPAAHQVSDSAIRNEMAPGIAAVQAPPEIRRGRAYALILLFACLVLLPGLGRPALWEPDEGRYAEIAREMVISGDYLNPRDNWVLYFEKPPLVYWLCAASIKVFGANEFAVRLPIALFSVGSIMLTAALAEMMSGMAAAMAAASVLGLSPLFFGFGRSLTLDPALAFFVTAALALFYAAYREARDPGRVRLRLWAVSLMLAFGTLTKGPVAVVLAGAIVAIYLAWEQRIDFLKHVPWLSGVLLFGAVAAPWFVIVAARNPGFASFFFIHEHLHRYVANTEHGWGPYFFVAVVVAGTWPWCFFAWPQLRAWLGRDHDYAPSPEQRSAMRFLIVWFSFVLVFFSLPRSKLGSYVLPALPPLAIMAGMGLARIWANRSSKLGGLALINAMVAAVAIPVIIKIGMVNDLKALAMDLTVALAALLAGAVAAWLIAKNSARAALAALMIGVATALALTLKAREDSHQINSYRKLAREIAPRLEPQCVLASYRHFVQALPFYTGAREKLVEYRGELAPFGDESGGRETFVDSAAALQKLWSESACMVMVVNRNDLSALSAMLTPPPKVIAGEGKKVAIASQR